MRTFPITAVKTVRRRAGDGAFVITAVKTVRLLRDPRRGVRAADLQEEPTKPTENKAYPPISHFVGSDEDGGYRRTSQRAERAIRHSERSERSEPSDTASAASGASHLAQRAQRPKQSNA